MTEPARIPRCPHCGMTKWCRPGPDAADRPACCTRIDGGPDDGLRQEYVEAYGDGVL